MEKTVKELFKLLKSNGLKISTAESCTGGLFTKLITDLPGSSAVLDCSVVTYANEAKVKLLGVSEESIKKYGVVSEAVACEMARGAARLMDADIGVGITGIAGPDGGTSEKPVGLVWTAVFYRGEVRPFELRLHGTRDEIRQKTCQCVFENIIKVISKKT
ncbi:MAG: CinA family protein [Clostridia bacterium]|nr:CinA family protein [Clostridia bacterium]